MSAEKRSLSTEVLSDTKAMIDGLKSVCANAGLANDSSEYKIITEAFLYKYLNDKFIHDLRKLNEFQNEENIEDAYASMVAEDRELALLELEDSTAIIRPEYLLSTLFNQQNIEGFAALLDEALIGIANDNSDVFAVKSGEGQGIKLFNGISRFILAEDRRDNFASRIVDKMTEFSFERAFDEKYDFFAQVFEYLIADYNKDSGKYGEFFTPHSIATIIARILVPDGASNVTVYDPAAGTGTLVLAAAHLIGEDRCTIYTQDRSQKANEFLRLNLVLNNLVHSLPHVINDDTLENPRHLETNGKAIKKFDFIVSNPPFNSDFSDIRDKLAGEAYSKRFWAGVPAIPKKKLDGMAIYLLFLQHIITSMKDDGKAAIVVPTGFLTDSGAIPTMIREEILNQKMLSTVLQMPPLVFANTNTSVSIIFLEKGADNNHVMMLDASHLGTSIKLNGIKRTLLSKEDQDFIVDAIKKMAEIPELSKKVPYEEIDKKSDDKYKALFKPGLYFGIKYSQLDEQKTPIEAKEKEYIQKQQALLSQLLNHYSRNLFIDWFVDFHFPGVSSTNCITEIGEIPDNLKLIPLYDLVEVIGGDWGKEAPEGNYTELIRCIRGADLPKVAIADYSGVPIRYVLKKNVDSKQLRSGDIIVEISGGSPVQSTGRLLYVTKHMISDSNTPLLCTNFCRALRAKNLKHSKYIYDYLSLLYDKGYFFNLENNTTGIKNLLLNPFLQTIKVLIPDDETVIDQYYANIEEYVKSISDSGL